eukprot:925006-Amorphochlora_amoeboformis.AAC.2
MSSTERLVRYVCNLSITSSSRGRFKRQRREKSMFGDHEDDLFWFSSDEEKDPKLTARLGTTEPPVVFEGIGKPGYNPRSIHAFQSQRIRTPG